MCCTRLAENAGCKNYAKKSPSAYNRTTLMGYILATKAHIDSWKKNLLKSSISSTGPHNVVNFSQLTLRSVRSSTPANFNTFSVLASSLRWRRSTDVNQTLHDVWPWSGLVHCIYIFGDSCPLMEFCQVQNSLCIQILCSPILAALLDSTRAVAWYKQWNYGAFAPRYFQQRAPPIFRGCPSRLAYAHILVEQVIHGWTS